MGTVAAVGACLLAWGWRSPTGFPRVDQLHALVLASGWTWGWLGRRHRLTGGWCWLIAWALPVALIWRESYQFGWVWLGIWISTVSALGLLSQEPRSVRKAVVVCGLLQLPLMGLQGCGTPLFDGSGSGLWGSLGRRAVLSALLGLCSLWSVGWKAWAWMIAAALTGSLMGVVPSLWRLLWRARHSWRVWAATGVVLGLLVIGWWVVDATAPLRYLTSRLAGRWEVLQGVCRHPWPPVGFTPLRPPAFVEQGLLAQLLHWEDYHSLCLESWTRFGPWALLLGVGMSVWFWRRSGVWVWLWAAGLALAQSLEAYPATAWLLGMALIGGRDGVGEIQKTGGVS